MEYVKTNEYVTENAVVRAFHPVLSDEEREIRKKNLEEAASKFWIDAEMEAQERAKKEAEKKTEDKAEEKTKEKTKEKAEEKTKKKAKKR